jgi:NADPH:quinone reductase-like Zn-dependent oxidoreductase
MKAIVCRQYGSPDVLHLEDVDTPEPGEKEVRVKILATSINAGDWHLMRADPWLVRLAFGLRAPRHPVFGADIAGVVDTVGEGTFRFKPGDPVFGDVSANGFGGFAEYVCVPEDRLAPKPAGLSFEQAACVPAAGMTALQGVRDKGELKAGEHILINGASGGVGSYAVQIAKALDAEVTGVCSTRNVDYVRELGADHVIDYTKEDFSRRGKQYDVIVAANGNQSIFDYKRALRPGGRYVSTGGAFKQFIQAATIGAILSKFSDVTMRDMLMHAKTEDLLFLSQLIEEGKLKPFIDRTYPLEQVPDAIRHMEDQHVQGKLAIKVAE